MKTRGILTATAALVLLFGGVTACSSDDARSSTPKGAASSTSASPSATTPARPAVTMVGHGGVGTYCLVPTKKGGFPDFVWTGVRLRVRDSATITAVTAQRHGVDVLHTWVVEGGNNNTGAIVPWSGRHTFLRHLDWPHRAAAEDADLTAGTPYTLVMRLRPHDGATLHDLEVHYRSAAGTGSDTDPDTLKFDKSC